MRTPNRWAMLSLGMAAQGSGCVFMYGLPFLLPALQAERGLSLAQAGILVGAPSAGMLFTLIAWGWVADRYGERLAMTTGLALATVFLTLAALSGTPAVLAVMLALAGAAGASANAASGRVVLGWFPKERRGVAMGWRQTAQPLGVAVAGAVIPPSVHLWGVRGALLVMAAITLVTTVSVGLLVVDPPRGDKAAGERTASPYRAPALWRIHGASMLLVVPQFVTAGFALTYLVSARHWEVASAAQLVAAAQFGGAAGRLLCGRWSDRVGSRVRPMRRLALVNGTVMALLATAAQVGAAAATPLLIAALIISMSGNGLAFTAVSELAGSSWAGRAMGVQNTAQNLVSAATPGAVGALITGTGFATAFGLAGALALAAALATPGQAESAPEIPAPRATAGR
ncbi:MFS family permease [Streptosporangium album]|uniref:MFS family permease n=1 Tax=Streptosporangium album TaxID=47479 RepID=A0A7W7RS38_9ACTN|nr:MFS transporter [Streptosporangium album]MBB4937158.1 MFS family permease [Streptosporangium album]